jgi:hypothetical protein
MNTRQTTDGQATHKYYYFTIDICGEKSLILDKRVVKGKNTALKLLTLIVRGLDVSEEIANTRWSLTAHNGERCSHAEQS